MTHSAPEGLLLENPYTTELAARREAAEAILRCDPRAEQRRREPEARTRWALARAVAESNARPSDPPSSWLPARESTGACPRDAVLATVAASLRCQTELATLAGASRAMERLRERVWTTCFGRSLRHSLLVSRVIRDHDVLIFGETGTGKETVARAILAGTPALRCDELPPSREINVAAFTETLVESELFGHVKGAFTGAASSRAGLVRSAHLGCLFLDEVGDLPMTTQTKVLRVIENDEVRPVGSDATHSVDVRFVAATHRDLRAAVSAGRFREDLLQRIAGTTIVVAPLRERPSDVPVIGEALLERMVGACGAELDVREARAFLASARAREHAWPGNVRELGNVLRDLVIGLPIVLEREAPTQTSDLPAAIREAVGPLATVERWYVDRVLAAHGGNVAAAARVLGVDRATVGRKLALGA